MPTPNPLQHTINHELLYQLTQIALDMRDAKGSHERMILTEQYDTLQRFIDCPGHVAPEAYNRLCARAAGRPLGRVVCT